MDTQTTAPHTPADRAHQVGQEAKQAAQGVASTAAQETRRTTREAKDEARQLWSQTRTELTDQAGTQQARAASALHELAEQLGSMARGSDQDGMARSVVEDVARRADDAASWLDQRDPGTLLQDVRDVARRRPGAFLAVAAGLGVVAGRLSRSLLDDAAETAHSPEAGTTTTSTPTNGTGYATGGLADPGMPSATGPTVRTTQPIAPDGTPTPIDSEGLLGAPDLPSRGPR